MTWPTKTDFADGDVLTAAQVNNIGTNLNEADPTGITDGYVLTADGAGGMGWELPGGGWTLISSDNQTGVSLTDYTISSLPQTYKSLLLVWRMGESTTATPMLRWNGLTSNYWYSGTVRNSNLGNTFASNGIYLNGASGSGGGTFPWTGQVFFPNYTNSYEKYVCMYASQWSAGYATNGVGTRTGSGATLNSLTLLFTSGNIANISYELYGL